MDKTELLFRMMEQPEKYDDEQWRAILSDKDCRELYATMSLTKSAIDAKRCDQQTDEITIQKEWERFAANHHDRASNTSRWRRIAAAVVILAFFGIAAAAVYSHYSHSSKTEMIENTVSNENQQETVSAVDVTDAEAEKPQSHLYDNVPLEQIMDDIASTYNVEVEWQNENARNLRLYYQWEPSFSLDDVVEMLNHFESIKITRSGDKLIISDTAQDR